MNKIISWYVSLQFNASQITYISYPDCFIRSSFTCPWSQHHRKISGTWHICAKLQWGSVVWAIRSIWGEWTCFYNLWSFLEEMLEHANGSCFTYSSMEINSSWRYDMTVCLLLSFDCFSIIGLLISGFC